MPAAATTPSAVRGSGITRAGRRRAIDSSTRCSGRARRNVFWRGAVMRCGSLLTDGRQGVPGRAPAVTSALEHGFVVDPELPVAVGRHVDGAAHDDAAPEADVALDRQPLAR